MNQSHKTAMKRKVASAPALWLNKQGLLVGKKLDYGCGHGCDAERFDMDKYDPYFFPESPRTTYDTITCTYVLNVIESEQECEQVVENIRKLLSVEGIAYITVRRDIPREGTSRQFWIELPFKVIRNNGSYTIYRITNAE